MPTLTPHPHMAVRTERRESPSGDNRYSISDGGPRFRTVRVTSPARSSSRKRSVNTRADSSGIDRRSIPKRESPSLIRARITVFHLPPRTLRVTSTGQPYERPSN